MTQYMRQYIEKLSEYKRELLNRKIGERNTGIILINYATKSAIRSGRLYEIGVQEGKTSE